MLQITSLNPTRLLSHASRIPFVIGVGLHHSTSKVLLQHDGASLRLPVPARDFEQWQRGLRLSDKPQGKHILFSSYCLSLCCIVLRGGSIGCHLIRLSRRNPAYVVTYWIDVERSSGAPWTVDCRYTWGYTKRLPLTKYLCRGPFSFNWRYIWLY